MTVRFAAVAALAALSACGVDGPPVAPLPDAPRTQGHTASAAPLGLSVSGEAAIGMVSRI